MDVTITTRSKARIQFFKLWFYEVCEVQGSYKRDVWLPEYPKFKLFNAFPVKYQDLDYECHFTISYEKRERVCKECSQIIVR